MKNFLKRIIALSVCCILFANMVCGSAGAVAPEYGLENEKISEDEYFRYTVDFSEENKENSNMVCSTDSNEMKIARAIEFVESLELDERGFEYIEQSCLAQLNDFANQKDISLESYTVLVPKTTNTTPQYFGTYKGFTFYSAYYSEYVATVHGPTSYPDNKQTMIDFVAGVLDYILLLADQQISVSFTLLSTVMNDPKNYEVTTSAHFKSIFSIEANCRGIYTKTGANNSYVMYYSSEDGYMFPQVIFFPNAKGERPSVTLDLPKEYVAMPNFSDKEYQMKQAYDWIFYAGTPYPERHHLAGETAEAMWG